MRKKLVLGIFATLFVASAVVFASTNSTTTNTNSCPNRPGCICSPKASALSVNKTTNTQQCIQTCPDRPGCVCTK